MFFLVDSHVGPFHMHFTFSTFSRGTIRKKRQCEKLNHFRGASDDDDDSPFPIFFWLTHRHTHACVRPKMLHPWNPKRRFSTSFSLVAQRCEFPPIFPHDALCPVKGKLNLFLNQKASQKASIFRVFFFLLFLPASPRSWHIEEKSYAQKIPLPKSIKTRGISAHEISLTTAAISLDHHRFLGATYE